LKVEDISGVILAGGENKRFKGIIKSNIVIGKSTILEKTVETISSLFGEIIIVTNTPDEFNISSSCRFTGDHYLNKGPLGGIHAAMKASKGRSVFVFAGDMPFLDRSIIEKQIKVYLKTRSEILVPEINGLYEPLHSIYSNQLICKLEDYLVTENVPAVRSFFKYANVSFLKFRDSEKSRKAFMNINTLGEALEAESKAY
jgi:molybdopterin-guanine dinucleotide biosynthesis protein A